MPDFGPSLVAVCALMMFRNAPQTNILNVNVQLSRISEENTEIRTSAGNNLASRTIAEKNLLAGV